MLRRLISYLKPRCPPLTKTLGERTLVISDKYFELPDHVLSQLRRYRLTQERIDQIEQDYDAFLLDPGFGPAAYLTADGRMIWDDDGWGIAPSLGRAYGSIIVGAEKMRLPALMDLLPKRPAGTPDCEKCGGTGLIDFGAQVKDVNNNSFSFGCGGCWGMGWQAITADGKKAVQSRTVNTKP